MFRCPKMKVQVLLMKTRYHLQLIMLFVFALCLQAEAMIFKSDEVAAQWDTWCYYHEGTYYTYYLVTEYGYGEGVGVATSTDGVHWEDHGWVIRQSDENTYYLGSGSVWKSPDFDKTGKFICNYSEHRNDESGKRTQNILFAWSTDLIHWNKFGDEKMFKVDTRYYKKYGRWDCIFAYPRDEGGYWGTWSANGKTVNGTVGIGYSEDGVTWKALPAPTVESGAKEAGAFYPIDGKIYAMFISKGGMWAHSADSVTGPYMRSPKNAHLVVRGHTAFARFLPTSHGLLAHHYQMSGTTLKRTERSVGRDREITYVSPFKRAVIDHEGILRWKYWEGNEVLKGDKLTLTAASDGDIQVITDELDLNKGIILEGSVKLPESKQSPVTLIFNTLNKHYALRILHNGAVEMGSVDSTGKNWKKVHGVNREWEFGKTVTLRIFLRAGMMEVYLDDHFMECWTMGCYGAKTVTIGVLNGEMPVENIALWQMSLAPAKAPAIVEPLKATVTASSIYNSGYAAKYAADGDTSSRWCSSKPYGKSEWLQLDLRNEQTISKVIIDWEKAFAKTYELQVSNNAEDWTVIYQTSEGKGGRDVIDKLNASGRYVRIALDKRGTEHGYSIYEVKVFESTNTDCLGTEPLFENSDFEMGALENWTAKGNAFTQQPTKGDNIKARGRGASGQQGEYWIGTYEQYDGKKGKPGQTRGDQATGTLTSKEFKITQSFINFRVGGGDIPEELGVKLECAGEELLLASGNNREEMRQVSVDVSAFLNKKARLVIYDSFTGGWGHINVDDFTASNQALGEQIVPIHDFWAKSEVTLTLTQPILNVKIPSQKKRLTLSLQLNQMVLGKYSVDLKHIPCDYAYINLDSLMSDKAKLTVRGLKRDIAGITLDDHPKGTAPVRLQSQVAVKAFHPNGIKMVYTPSEGKIWDPSLLWHDGYYYFYAMHKYYGNETPNPNIGNYNSAEWYGMWGAKSKDGVHWEDLGPVIKDCSFKVWKMFVMHTGEHFIAAHGSFSGKPGHGNDTQRHWKSIDGIKWEYLGKETDTHPDPRWYRKEGRWDCMYMIPKEDEKGWLGYTVATVLNKGHGLGKLESDDGIHWKVLPPIAFDWEGVASGFAEFVGIEKIGDRYYSICGKGLREYGLPLYSVYTFVSDSPAGPFKPDKKAFRYCGGSGVEVPPQWLAAMGRGQNNEILITNYVGSNGWGPDVTLLPIKKAVVDDGHLRPGYWKNNDAAKGSEKPIVSEYCINASTHRTITLLDQNFDFHKGIILEGIVTAKATSSQNSYAGIYLDHQQAGHGTGILMGIGEPETRLSYIGLLRDCAGSTLFDPLDDIAGPETLRRAGLGVANVTGISDSTPHTFRLWIRQGLLELYIDDIAMQTFFTGPANGTVGFLAENAEVTFNNLKYWEMNID